MMLVVVVVMVTVVVGVTVVLVKEGKDGGDICLRGKDNTAVLCPFAHGNQKVARDSPAAVRERFGVDEYFLPTTIPRMSRSLKYPCLPATLPK